MAAPERNEFWKLRSKHGRDKIFSDPQIFNGECYEYFRITTERTLDEEHWVGKDADSVTKHHPVPFTISGLCIFLGISRSLWRDYKGLDKYKDFLPIITHVEDIIYTQKFEYAATGFFNVNLISNELGIKNRVDVTTDDKEIKNIISFGGKDVEI